MSREATLLRSFLVLLVTALPATASATAQRLKPQEVVTHHLAAVGPAAARSAWESIVLQGTGVLKVVVGEERTLTGPALFAAQGRRMYSGIEFDLSDYPAEQLSFDGDQTYVRQLVPGQRSRIGEFIYRYEEILTEGLFGGVLSTAWPLLDMKQTRPRLRYRGLRQFGEHKMHELSYERRRGRRDLDISLYFLDDSFRHVATVYRLEAPEEMTLPTRSTSPASRATQSSTKVRTMTTLEENFSGFFQTEQGLVLPSRWTVRLTTESPDSQFQINAASRDLSVLEWSVTFQNIQMNVDIAAERFRLY